jgi:hypothetical protein
LEEQRLPREGCAVDARQTQREAQREDVVDRADLRGGEDPVEEQGGADSTVEREGVVASIPDDQGIASVGDC